MNKTQEALKMAIKSMKELQGSVITSETNCGGYKCRELYCRACFDDDTVEDAINNSKAKVEKAYKVIQACEEALAELQEQNEPFGIWHVGETEDESDFFLYKDSGDVWEEGDIYLYTSPPKREWIGLSVDDITKLIEELCGSGKAVNWDVNFAKAIEAKLKELNT